MAIWIGLRLHALECWQPSWHPQLEALTTERSTETQQSIFDQCAQHALAYTPAVYQGANHTVLLEIEASLRLFGGVRKILYGLRQRVSVLHNQLSTSVAPTPTGAWLLANVNQARQRYACSYTSLTRALDPLPCLVLPGAQAHRQWLDAIGCNTLKELRTLPRAGLSRRVGLALLQELDAAYSQTHTTLKTYQPAPQFMQRLDLTERMDHTVAIMHRIEHMLARLCVWLVAKRSALTRLRIILHHERYKESAVHTQHDLAFGEPVHTLSGLMLLVHEHIERLPLKDSVIALTVESITIAELQHTAGGLFPETLRTPAERRKLFDLLTARLGPQCLLHPAAVADHRPEIANNWISTPSNLEHAAQDGAPQLLDRPFWLLPVPIALRVERNRPIYRTALELLRGPERLECGWWDGPSIARDYFEARDTTGARYWIYRERDADPPHWYLHGLFS